MKEACANFLRCFDIIERRGLEPVLWPTDNRVVIIPTLSLLAAPHIFILGLFEVFPPPGGYYSILIRKTAPLMNSERQLISWKACFH